MTHDEMSMQPPWEALPKWVQYVAADKGYDLIFGYEYEPRIVSSQFFNNGGRAISIGFLNFPRGNMPWDKSLVKRPEGV